MLLLGALMRTLHDLMAITSNLYDCIAVGDEVVDTIMERLKTSEQALVARIIIGIAALPDHIHLPQHDGILVCNTSRIQDAAL